MIDKKSNILFNLYVIDSAFLKLINRMLFSLQKRFFFVIAIYVLLPLSSYCQDFDKTDNGYRLNINYLQGTIIDHSVNMSHLADQHPRGIEFDLNKQTYGNSPWQKLYKYPKIGVAFHYMMMDLERPLGNSLSITPYYNPTLKRTEKFDLSYKIGGGIGYIEKRYHPETNPTNNLISSRLNFSLFGNINLSYQLYRNLTLNTGLSLLHFSNGAYKIPNLGINIPALHIGVGLGGQRPPVRHVSDSVITYQKKTYLNIVPSVGVKEVPPYFGQKWRVSSLSTYASRTISRKSLLNLGMDFFYYSNYTTHLHNPDPESLKYLITSALLFGHELVINKVVLGTQVGYYIYDPLSPNTSTYQRVSLRYFFTKNISAGVALKTHFANADFVEWGLGIRL
jgi:hypothetical protein